MKPIILDRCPCGQPWVHYRDSEHQRIMVATVAAVGPTVRWYVGVDTYLVARHYLALHGMQSWRTDIGFPKLGQPGCLVYPEIPAITCSKCGRTNYNADDVMLRFCGSCGVWY